MVEERRSPWRLFANWLLLLAWTWVAAVPAHAQEQEQRAIVLDAAHPDIAPTGVPAWMGPTGAASIAAASSGRLPFTPGAGDSRLQFGPGVSLWLKLRLQRSPNNAEAWSLQVPVTIVDRVTVYQQDATGAWVGQSAGDLVPSSEWPRPGRYPTFPLAFRDAGPTDVFMEVRHSVPLTVPLRVVTAAEHQHRTQLEYLSLGVLVGVLVLLLAGSLVRAALLRDGLHAWFSLFALLAMLAIGAFTGAAGHLLWGEVPTWMDAAPGSLTLLASAASALLFARLSVLATRGRWVGLGLRLLTPTGALLSILYLLLDRSIGVMLLALQPLLVALLGLYASFLTWRRGDAVGLWMLLGAIPLCVSVLVSMVRVTGVLPPSWASEYLLVLALTLNLPMLLVALNSRSEERRSVELRRAASASQDPLTGLMKRGPFLARLQQTVARHQRSGESAAVAVIELSNYAWIRTSLGEEAAEEALLRTVIQLRRLVRDVDTTGRVGENSFGLILEGVAVRDGIARVASRLIAAGLMHDPEQPPEPELHLHVAAVMLNEHSAPAEQLLEALKGVLSAMSARTRRPFRFYEPNAPQGTDSLRASLAPET